MRQTDGQTAQRKQVQAIDQGEGINVQGWTQPCLRTMVCWGRDWCLTFYKGRHHKLISFTREQASFGISLPYAVKLGNALNLTT